MTNSARLLIAACCAAVLAVLGITQFGSREDPVGSTTGTTFGSTCYIGLAVGSGNTTLNPSQFSNVLVTS